MLLLSAAAALMAPVEKTWMPPPPPIEFRDGIYSGTFGARELRACHNGLGIRYYEMGNFQVHALYQQTPTNVWARRGEGLAAPLESWAVTAREDGAVDVVRTTASETASGQLRPMAAPAGGDFSCSSDMFIGPKIRELETTTTLDSFADEGIWRVVRNPGPGFPLADMQSIELDGTRPGDSAINDLFRKEATLWNGQFDHLACERRNIDANGASTIFRLHHEPVMLNQRFSSVRFRYEVQCGNILNRGDDVRLFDRTSGELVDPAQWFAAEALKPMGRGPDDAFAVPGFELAELLQSLSGGSRKKCIFDPVVQFPAAITVRPGGFAFERADLKSGDCDPVILPWLKAAPMMNEAGKVAILDLARKKRPAKGGAATKPLVDY